MRWALDYWQSSIGGKVTMAVTGLLLFLFVVAHLLGNPLVFAGPEALADYAHFLHAKPALLWSARIGLLAAFLLHVATGIRLAAQNRSARPVAYAVDATVQATFASRSMLFTGLLLLAYLVYHLLHFTFGVAHPTDSARRAERFDGQDVYAMVTSGFAHPAVAIAYAAAQLVLFLHLRHGIQSFAQTLGFHHQKWTPWVRTASWLLAALVAGGNVVIALSVQLGIVAPAP
jgi:succinate dehydrogenase cytochrome b subunit